jgi:uncharacterized protein (DUF58 family)
MAAARLRNRSIYMLPTREGLIFSALIVALLLAAVNYQNAMAYLLTFTLIALALVSMLVTQRNLLGLTVSAGPAPEVFAGGSAAFVVRLTNDSDRARYGLSLKLGRRVLGAVDLAPHATAELLLPEPAPRRGWLPLPPFALTTRYPLGLVYAWTRRLQLDARTLVYPRPADEALLPEIAAGLEDGGLKQVAGDDFHGLRAFRPGDSPHHVSWKTAARGLGLHVKEFGGGGRVVWLDWHSLSARDAETRLSQLTRAVLDAEAVGLRYGLRLPGTELVPAHGPLHATECLRHLALHALA